VQPGGVAARAGVKPADVLISINGQEMTSPEQPSFKMNESTLIVLSRNGERREIRLELKTPAPKYRDNPYAEPDSLVAKVLPPAIGYLKVSLFPGKIGIDFANQLAGERLSLLSFLEPVTVAGQVGDWEVLLRGRGEHTMAGRLCALRKSEEAIQQARQRLKQKARRKQIHTRAETWRLPSMYWSSAVGHSRPAYRCWRGIASAGQWSGPSSA
jgi:PDZ domain